MDLIQEQEVPLEDLAEKEQEKVEEVKVEEPMALNESSISNIENLDESIELKVKNMMPSIIEQVKTEVLRESQIKSTSSKVLETEASKEEIKMENKNEKSVHQYFVCDGCGKDPIVGARYKCAICHDFDLCEDCEANTIHDHPFLKIRHPGQKPMKIICILNEQDEGIEINGQNIQIPGLQQGLNMAQQFF